MIHSRLIKHGHHSDYTLSRPKLRQLARTGGLRVTSSSSIAKTEAYSLASEESLIDWDEARAPIRTHPPIPVPVPAESSVVDAKDTVLKHMKMLGPRGNNASVPLKQQPFVIFENVKNLMADAQMLAERDVPKKLGLHVLRFNSGEASISEARRDRLYWSNIPLPRSSEGTLIFSECSFLRDKPPFDPRTRLNCLTSKEGVTAMNSINVKLSALAVKNQARGTHEPPILSQKEWKDVKTCNLLFAIARSGGWRLRMLKVCERCRIMGFPENWCDHFSTTEAAKMLGQSFHVPTIMLLLSGMEKELRARIMAAENPLGTQSNPLVVLSFFDGIGGGWLALHQCLEQWGLADIHIHYIAIENDAKCRNVLLQNFPPPAEVKTEHGVASYHLHQHSDASAKEDFLGDIELLERAVVGDAARPQREARPRYLRSKTGELARLENTFLVFNGFPCINVAGLNRAPGENGRQRSMQEGQCGPQTGLYYKAENILGRILQWRQEVARRGRAGQY